MATLVLPGTVPLFSTPRLPAHPSLRAWLNGDWAILFSHPDDFVRCELEQDRWLAIVQQTFTRCRARPLAVGNVARQLDAGWVSDVTGDTRAVFLDDGIFTAHARRLRERIVEAGCSRFVMIIDSALLEHQRYVYSDLTGIPSPLEFVARLAALRTGSRRMRDRTQGEVVYEEAPVAYRPPARVASITA